MIKQIQFFMIHEDEYNVYKAEIKKLFPYASVRRNKQDYANGGFNINPTKKINYEFSQDQLDLIMQWLVDKDLWVLDNSAKDYQKIICNDNVTILYRLSGKDGFSFIQKYKEIN